MKLKVEQCQDKQVNDELSLLKEQKKELENKLDEEQFRYRNLKQKKVY